MRFYIAVPMTFFAVLCGARTTLAVDVYKCTTPQGDVAFQDGPCPAGAVQTQVRLADAPPAQALSAAPVSTDSPPQPPPGAAQPAMKAQPPAPLPALWLCVNAADGKPYVSRNGNPPLRYVPLGMLGIPGKALSEAYGSGGIGVSAPGVRKIPVDASPQAALGAEYTPLQDTCAPASREQTCAYLRKQFGEIDDALRKARFNDERARLQPQADELQAQLGGC